MISRVDHVAIAVQDYESALRFFTHILGAIPGSSGEDTGMKYYWENLYLGDLSRLELLTPTGRGSFIDKFLSDREGGVHHIALQTPDIYEAKAVLEENSIPYFGFNDFGQVWKEFFIHPRNAFGALIQIAEFNADDWIAPSVRMPRENRWDVQKTDQGVNVRFAHPGGGTVSLPLDTDEIQRLIHDLSESLKPSHDHET